MGEQADHAGTMGKTGRDERRGRMLADGVVGEGSLLVEKSVRP